MKKGIYLLLFAIIGLVCYSLFYNAKTHVQAVQVADELVVKTDSLDKTVKILHKQKDSVMQKIEVLDSVIGVKDQIIDNQESNLTTLKRDKEALRKMGPIVIHDTVYVTETKNFWGKKKKTIENVSSTDTLEIESPEPDTTIQKSEPDTIK